MTVKLGLRIRDRERGTYSYGTTGCGLAASQFRHSAWLTQVVDMLSAWLSMVGTGTRNFAKVTLPWLER